MNFQGDQGLVKDGGFIRFNDDKHWGGFCERQRKQLLMWLLQIYALYIRLD